MRHLLITYVLVLMLLIIRAEQKIDVKNSEVTKLEVVDLGETKIESDSDQSDIQQKRHSGYFYNKPNRPRLHLQINQPKSQIISRIPVQLNKPFTRYGPPNPLTLSVTKHNGYHAQQDRDKLQTHVSQQQSSNFDDNLVQQEIPSPVRNLDFTVENSIASQNNEPFGMHTANYLPPQNQKLPAYASTDNFSPQSYSLQSFHNKDLQNQNLLNSQKNHQISDAALFLSENSQAIQQLYGAPASNQDFAPSSDQFQDPNNQIQNPNSQFSNFESTSQNPQEFRTAFPSYASGTFNSQETLEQIQSLEKDRLIVQLQQALAQAQTTPSSEIAGRYAQNQASFIQNQDLLASIGQQMKLHIPTTPQNLAFGSENTAFSQSTFLPGTTINSLNFPFNYDVSTTTQSPTTTTGISTEQSSKNDGIIGVASSLPNRPGLPPLTSPVGIPIYGGFVPTFISGNNFIPNYSTSIFTSGHVTPGQSIGSSPTHFGIPIPTEPAQKPLSDSASSTPATTKPSSIPESNRPGVPLAPAITPIALPVQPIRPVAPLHPLAAPIHPITAPLQPVLPATLTQVHPVQATPAVTSGVQPTYGLHTSLVNSVFYKPIKAVYPVYYYPNIAYQLQKPALPSYPWNYAPSYSQPKPTQIWK